MKKLLLLSALFFLFFTTLQSQVPSSNVQFSNIGMNGFRVSWSPGGGDGRIVVIRASTSSHVYPTDGINYTANASFGSGSNLGNANYVVYKGTGSLVTVSNLVSNTLYYVYIYEYNSTAFPPDPYNYNTTSYGFGSHATTTTQPTVQATAITLIEVGKDYAEISLTPGNGGNRIITLAPGTGNSNVPSDGFAYAASTAYGSGSAIGTAYVVMNSTASTVKVTGLTANTYYTVNAFEYNIGLSGSQNYLTSSYPTKTLVTEPTSAPTSLNITEVNSTSFRASWVKGDGANRIVTVKKSNINTALSFDGIDDYVSVPHHASLKPTSEVTLELWAYHSNWASAANATLAGCTQTGGYNIEISGGVIRGTVRLNNAYSYAGYSCSLLSAGWHHFAVTSDGQYTRFYVDGVEKAVSNAGAVYPIQYSVSNNFVIGSEAGVGTTPDGPYFTGHIDEVRVWSNARGVVMLNNVKNQTLDLASTNYPNLMGYWTFDDAGAITNPNYVYNYTTAANTSPNTTSINGTLTNFGYTYFGPAYGSFTTVSRWVYSGARLDCPLDGTAYTANAAYSSGSAISWNGYVVYSGTGNTVNITGLSPTTGYAVSVYEYNGSTGNYNYLTTVYASNGQRTMAADATTPASGLVFSNINTTSVTATWTSGNGGSRLVAVKPGRIRTALSFDGTDDHVNIPHTGAQNTYPLTVTAWVKTTDTDGGIVNKYTVGSYNGYQIFVSGGNIYGWYFVNNSNYVWPGVSPGDPNGGFIADGNWHHVAYVVDASGGKLYVDGALRCSNSWTGSPGACTTTQPIYIGYYPNSWYLNGQVDEATLYNTSLTQSTIKSRMRKSLNGNESGLIGYWKLDEGYTASSTIKSSALSTTFTDGTLSNFTSTAAAGSFSAVSAWVYSGSGVDAAVDQTYYSPSTQFLSGSQVGLPYYTVYQSTGNSVTVSNLSPNTYYNFSVYEMNKSNGQYNYDENYLIDQHLTGDVQTAPASPPSITSFTPSSGTVGTKVTIMGSNFGATANENVVYFGATRASILTASTTQLEVIVPNGATFQPLSVTANTLNGYSAKPFVVTQSCAGSIGITSFGNGADGTSDVSLTTYGNNSVSAVGDMDFDGKPDLVVSNGTDRFSYFKNASVQNIISFNAKNDYYINSNMGPQGIAVHDIDGNGKLDVLTIHQTTSRLTIHRNSTTSPGYIYLPAFTEYVTAANPVSVTTGDLDKDGRADVIVGNTGSTFSIFRNISSVGAIELGTRTDYTLAGDPAKISIADIDGDGKADLVVSLRSGTKFSVYRNTSSGIGNITFAAAVDYSTPGVSIMDAALGDLDNDGKIDAAVARSTGGVGIYRNNSTIGNINLVSMSTLSALANTPYSVAMSDLDGDNKVDVVLGYNAASNVSVFKNMSTGAGNFNFASKVDYSVPAGTPAHVAIADFNADSKSDLVSVTGTTAEAIFTNRINELSPEPTSASSSVTFYSVGTTSMSFSWTNGNGSNHLVVMKAGSAVSQTPFDAVQYSPNTIFASGSDLGGGNYVVHNGSGNSVTVTGLNSYTYYHIAVFDFNGSTACQLNYLVSPAATGNQRTLNVPPTISAIANPAAICQNSGLQSINFSGVGTGGEIQSLSVTASSNNTALIPNPTVNYISANPTGTMSYTPVNGQSGTAVITVTVNDYAANNNTTTTTFTVTVIPNPTTSNAGSNVQICTDQTNLSANTPAAGSGTWNVDFTTNGAITNSNFSPDRFTPTAIISGLNVNDSVRLSWTIGNPPCANSVSYVSVKRKACPLTADFTASQTSTCINSGDLIVFADNSFANGTTINSWSWNFGAGATPSTATGQGPHSVTYTVSSGLKTVTLDITNTIAGADNETKISFIDVQPLPSAAGSIVGSSTVCEGQAGVSYTVAAISNATSYSWNLPAGASVASNPGTNMITVDFAPGASSGNISVTGVNDCGNGAASSTFSVTVNPMPGAAGAITGTSSVCEGVTGITYSVSPVANATTYSWTLPAGASINGTSNTNTITVDFALGASSGDITVYGINVCGDGIISANFGVAVNPLPSAAGSITGSNLITGCPVTLGVPYSIAPITNATSYTWVLPSGATLASGVNSNSIAVDYSVNAVSGTLKVYGTNACGIGSEASLAITVNTLPDNAGTINGEDTITVCPSSTGIVYSISPVFNATTYSWTLPTGVSITSGAGTNSITVDFASNATAGNITVTPSNSCGTGATSPAFAVSIVPIPTLNVCLVTVDSASNYNRVVWTKPNNPRIDSIRIYREEIGGFQVLKTLSASAYSMYVDTTSKPNNTYARYKTALVDTCGNESALSDFHRTMFLQANLGTGGVINLNWAMYEGAPVLYYRILRGTLSTTLTPLDSVPGSNDLYTDTNPPGVDTVYYAVDVIWGVTCNASLRTHPDKIMGPISTSRSNIKALNRTATGDLDNRVLKDNLFIYPNPSHGSFTMEFASGFKNYNLEVFDMIGRIVYAEDFGDADSALNGPFKSSRSLNLEGLPQGVYTLSLKAGNGRVYARIIIQ